MYSTGGIFGFTQDEGKTPGKRVYGDVIPGHQPDKRILVLSSDLVESMEVRRDPAGAEVIALPQVKNHAAPGFSDFLKGRVDRERCFAQIRAKHGERNVLGLDAHQNRIGCTRNITHDDRNVRFNQTVELVRRLGGPALQEADGQPVRRSLGRRGRRPERRRSTSRRRRR